MMILLFLFSVNPFNEANFVPLPFRSVSVLSNPAGIGIGRGAELFLSYGSKSLKSGIVLGNLGFGVSHLDTSTVYELGAGFKLPGAFSIGYARQFGDTTENIIGLICAISKHLIAGYRTNLGAKKYMHAGAGIKIAGDMLNLAGEMVYEGIDDYTDYLFGFIISPTYGIKLNFLSDPDWNWSAGLNLGTSKLKLGLIYSRKEKKLTGGIILSAQSY
ncbi:MAG: hypothetical protein ABIL22_07500 [candidate division WOR-3 bacterium]